MGGRGTFAAGKNVAYTYKTVGKIGNIKILQAIDGRKSFKLPEESHSSMAYVLFDKDGVFHQYREYNENHEVVKEIGYHHESKFGTGDILHIHIFARPGIVHHDHPDTEKRRLTKTEYHKYKQLFRGVKIDEGKYFG